MELNVLLLFLGGAILVEAESPPQRRSSGAAPGAYFMPILAPHGQYTNNCFSNGNVDPSLFCSLPPLNVAKAHPVLEVNPLLAALILSSTLHLPPKHEGYNSAEHLPLNPYLSLLLSHYGKYSPIYGRGRGLYGYAAANNYHNNKPFGAYKIHEDNDG